MTPNGAEIEIHLTIFDSDALVGQVPIDFPQMVL